MIGQADEELQELDQLHVIILISIDRFVDYGHLRQVKKHFRDACGQEAPHALEDVLGRIIDEAFLILILREQLHDALEIELEDCVDLLDPAEAITEGIQTDGHTLLVFVLETGDDEGTE